MPELATDRGPIQFEQYGSRADAPLLLINGFGQQLIHWPPSLVDGLVAAGLRVIAFDNRDAGLSFGVAAAPAKPDELFLTDGAPAQPDGDGQGAPDGPSPALPYRLADMAADAIRLLDHLGQAGAHMVGMSLGGMIGQRLVMEHPQRVFSLTSISSTAGPFRFLGTGHPRRLGRPQAPQEEAAIVERAIAHAKALGGPTTIPRPWASAVSPAPPTPAPTGRKAPHDNSWPPPPMATDAPPYANSEPQRWCCTATPTHCSPHWKPATPRQPSPARNSK